MSWKRDLRGHTFSVMGAARSGLAVARLLVSRGAKVFVSDIAPEEKMPLAIKELQLLGVPYEFGGHSQRLFDAETMVISPGIPSITPVVSEAIAQGLTVVSELEVASWFCTAPIVAITGTNGKTTTTALTGRMFSDAGAKSVVAGNIGTAFSEVVENVTMNGTAVLEVSSFQLDFIRTFRPKVATILNITPDHLDRYDYSFGKYVAAKQRVFENQSVGDFLVYNIDNETTRETVEKHANSSVTLLPFSTRQILECGAFVSGGVLTTVVKGVRHELVRGEEISIRGEHNLANAMAAVLMASAMDVPAASISGTLKNFRGVEHRLEFVRELDGVTYINDSKATNVDSVWYALRAFEGPLIVLMGGRDKGNDYERLLDPVRTNVRAIVAIGESSAKIEASFAPVVPVKRASSMEEAVDIAHSLAGAGDTVLLSPACASFDWFNDYEHRGKVFKDIVMSLAPTY